MVERFAVEAREADAFRRECAGMMARGHREAGIGTLGERSMHAIVKNWLSPDPATQEIPLGSFVADILLPDGHVMEVQTQALWKLREKLTFFGTEHPVTVVYPYPLERYTVSLSPEGEVERARHKSTRPGRMLEVFDELVAIKSFLTCGTVEVWVLFLETTDYRMPGVPPGRKKKRASVRVERVPRTLLGRARLREAADYLATLPEGLPRIFSSADLAAAGAVPRATAQNALNVLAAVGAVEAVGKDGNARLYCRSDEKSCENDAKM